MERSTFPNRKTSSELNAILCYEESSTLTGAYRGPLNPKVRFRYRALPSTKRRLRNVQTLCEFPAFPGGLNLPA